MNASFVQEKDGFALIFGDHYLFRQCINKPAFTVAKGNPDIAMYRGNFDIRDNPSGLRVPILTELAENHVILSDNNGPCLQLSLEMQGDCLHLLIETLAPDLDRIHLSLIAHEGECIWGGGEQMSYLALSGRRFPIWTSEPGVGRDKSRELTRQMDEAGMAGGDYWTTNYPQPTILSSQGYACHLDESCYSVFDFSDPHRHNIEIWRSSAKLEFFTGKNPAELVRQLSERFGRQPALPDWAIGGAIVGLKDGANSFARLEKFVDAGTAISGLWCEDWVGIRETSFGRRLFWDWRWNQERYPDLPQKISELNNRGVRFLGYVNPYIAVDALLYGEAVAGGHLALRRDSDEVYLVDFGEFDCGVVDFTRQETRDWFAERIIGQEMLDLGLSGWMADFGEYLPTDVRLADGSDPMEAHNQWPVLWAQVNAQAIESRCQRGEALFFMRAGFTGVQSSCPLLWAGDQCVDFSRHDGIGTVITAALSSGLLGNAYSHSDCGGYTSLLGNIRSEELLMRWCELAAFMPVMRSHEGNRPDENLQYDSTPELLACFAQWSRIHATLAPYVRHLCQEAEKEGLPAMRPLFLHYPNDNALWTIQDQYLYGSDMLVAPIIEEAATERQVILPGNGVWRHLWSGQDYPAGKFDIEAPIGQPPVFYRSDSDFAALFAGLSEQSA